jgi:hypothetical protein
MSLQEPSAEPARTQIHQHQRQIGMVGRGKTAQVRMTWRGVGWKTQHGEHVAGRAAPETASQAAMATVTLTAVTLDAVSQTGAWE